MRNYAAVSRAVALAAAVVYPLSCVPGVSAQTVSPELQRAVIRTDEASSSVIQSIVDKVKPALVRIHVVESSPQAGREAKSESFGSGVIISPDGYVVTNHHVAGEAKWLSCTLSNKDQVDARLIGTDALSDIAVIKLAPQANGQPYPVAQWGDSGALRVGEAVLAMGSPFAFSQSVTAGIVSNTELVMPGGAGGLMLDGEDVGTIVRWIGHDAAIHPGNSGGPLVNLKGEVIGINEIQLGLSGAIPGDLAREVSSQIIQHGRVIRAYLGLELQPRLRSDTRESGALVSGVIPNSPAARAGFRPGDLLLQADEAKLDVRFPEQLPLLNLQLSRLPLNRPTTFTLLRGGQEMKISVTARSRENALGPSLEVRSLGITGMDITAPIALEMRLPDTNGVWVSTALQGGAASEAKPAIEVGDIIVAARGQGVYSLAGLKSILSRIPRRPEGTPTLIEVRREGERIACVANVNAEPGEDASVEVAKAYLPVSTQVVTQELAQILSLPARTQGVRVTQVHPDSAASAAGLKVGDVLTKLDNLEIEASQSEDTDVFSTMVRQYKIGGWMKISLLRRETINGKTAWKPRTVSIKLPQAPKQERELPVYRDENFGLALRDVTYTDRLRQSAAKGQQGALVTAVDQGSWAALAGLAEGDIIQRIGESPIRNMEEARTRLTALEKERSRRVVIFVSRGVHTLFVEMQTDWSLPVSTVIRTSGDKRE